MMKPEKAVVKKIPVSASERAESRTIRLPLSSDKESPSHL